MHFKASIIKPIDDVRLRPIVWSLEFGQRSVSSMDDVDAHVGATMLESASQSLSNANISIRI